MRKHLSCRSCKAPSSLTWCMWWDDFENGLQSTLYLRLVGLVERGYYVQQLHLGVLVQIKHGEQSSAWSGEGMAIMSWYSVFIVVTVPLLALCWLLCTLSVEVWSYGKNQWFVIAVASCMLIYVLIPYAKKIWAGFGQMYYNKLSLT